MIDEKGEAVEERKKERKGKKRALKNLADTASEDVQMVKALAGYQVPSNLTINTIPIRLIPTSVSPNLRA